MYLLLYFSLYLVVFLHPKIERETLNQHIKSVVASNDVVFYSPPTQRKHYNIHGNLPTGTPIGDGQFGGILNTNEKSLNIQLNHTDFWRHNPKTKFHPQYEARSFGLAQLKLSWDGLFSSGETNYFNRLNLFDAMVETSNKDSSSNLIIEYYFDVGNDIAVFTIKPECTKSFKLELSLNNWRSDA